MNKYANEMKCSNIKRENDEDIKFHSTFECPATAGEVVTLHADDGRISGRGTGEGWTDVTISSGAEVGRVRAG